jgi:hypothetical protein
MKLNKFKKYLNDLWANVIDDMNIDIFNHRILLATKSIDGEKITNYLNETKTII